MLGLSVPKVSSQCVEICVPTFFYPDLDRKERIV